MLFDVSQRGFLRPGYKADITIVRPHSPWTVSADNILSKCGWSPMEGHCFDWRVEKTLCNGLLVYDNGQVSAIKAGQEIQFCHP
jgi:dihydroorotase